MSYVIALLLGTFNQEKALEGAISVIVIFAKVRLKLYREDDGEDVEGAQEGEQEVAGPGHIVQDVRDDGLGLHVGAGLPRILKSRGFKVDKGVVSFTRRRHFGLISQAPENFFMIFRAVGSHFNRFHTPSQALLSSI